MSSTRAPASDPLGPHPAPVARTQGADPTQLILRDVAYVLTALFLPYGVVGTWQLRSLQWRQGSQRLLKASGLKQ